MEAFYREVYRGSSLSGEELPELLARSEDWLQELERKYRVTGSETDRKMALCALAETMSYFNAAQNVQGALRYASVGVVSVSGKGIYSMLDISPQAQERELYRVAGRYLEIYRGASGAMQNAEFKMQN